MPSSETSNDLLCVFFPPVALLLPWCWPDGGWQASEWRRWVSWSLMLWRLQTRWDGSFLLWREDSDSCSGVPVEVWWCSLPSLASKSWMLDVGSVSFTHFSPFVPRFVLLNFNVCVSAGGRSGVHVEFSSISFYFRSYGDLSDEEMDRVCQFLHNRVQNQEKTQLYQLTACFKAFKRCVQMQWSRKLSELKHGGDTFFCFKIHKSSLLLSQQGRQPPASWRLFALPCVLCCSVAFRSAVSCVDDLDESRSLRLKSLLSEYFDKRRDRSLARAPLDVEELDKYKVKHSHRDDHKFQLHLFFFRLE